MLCHAPGWMGACDAGRLWQPLTTFGAVLLTTGWLLASMPPTLDGGRGAPACRVQRLLADRIPVDLQPPVTLPAGVRRLEFQFAGTGSAADLRFRYRLGGFERDWIEGGAERVAHYTNIPPGRYTFEVTAAAGSGPWSPQPARLTFDLRPRLHQRRDVQVATVAVLALLLIGGQHVVTARRRGRQLARQVAARTEEMLDQHRRLEREIAERTRAQQETERARGLAEAANRAKSQFLANMSHEVRTPLNGIIGMTQLALETPLSTDQRDYLNLVNASADALMGVINDILDFSRIEAGRLLLDAVPFSLARLLHETLTPLAVRARDKGLVLQWSVDSRVPDQVSGDAGRLRQVIANLVGNALKFTEVGEVWLHVDPDDQTSLTRFTVVDTGIGIPAEKHSEIFEAFTQADAATTRRFGGAGLGLAIASRLVEMMGGRIRMESREGYGSTFAFTVRLDSVVDQRAATCEQPVDERSPQSQAAGQVSPSEASAVVPASSTPPPAEAIAEGECPRCRGCRVLVVEDNPVNQRLVQRVLSKHGLDVSVAHDGLQAVDLTDRESFDAVLMDVQMPQMSGLEATRVIRDREAGTHHHVPIIALTAHAMTGDREACLEAGMDAYLAKPVHREALIEMLHRHWMSERLQGRV